MSQSPWINGKECFKSTEKAYLLVYVVRPEPGLSSLVWVTRQQRRFFVPNLINILNYYHRLTNGLSIVDQNWDFLMNGVHLKKQRVLVPRVLLSISYLRPFSARATLTLIPNGLGQKSNKIISSAIATTVIDKIQTQALMNSREIVKYL